MPVIWVILFIIIYNGQTNRQHKDLQIYKYKGNKLGVEYYYSDLQVTMNDADKLNFTLRQGGGQNKGVSPYRF